MPGPPHPGTAPQVGVGVEDLLGRGRPEVVPACRKARTSGHPTTSTTPPYPPAWYATVISEPSGERHRKAGGTSGTGHAGLTPRCRNVTPASARRGTRPRVWPGTSVILAAVVVRPNRRSSSSEIPSPERTRRTSISSVWVVTGRACQASRPAATPSATAGARAPSGSASARWRIHDPVVQTRRSGPPRPASSAATRSARGRTPPGSGPRPPTQGR